MVKNLNLLKILAGSSLQLTFPSSLNGFSSLTQKAAGTLECVNFLSMPTTLCIALSCFPPLAETNVVYLCTGRVVDTFVHSGLCVKGV